MAMSAADRSLIVRMGGDISDLKAKLTEAGVHIDRTTEHVTKASRAQAGALRTAGAAGRDFAQMLSGVSALASVFARGNPAVARSLEIVSLAMSGSAAATRAFGIALQFASKHPILALITGVLALGGAAIALAKNWDVARAFLMTVINGLKDSFLGLFDITIGFFTRDIGRMDAGRRKLALGFAELRSSADVLASGVSKSADVMAARWAGLGNEIRASATTAGEGFEALGRGAAGASGRVKDLGKAAEEADRPLRVILERVKDMKGPFQDLVEQGRFLVDVFQKFGGPFEDLPEDPGAFMDDPSRKRTGPFFDPEPVTEEAKNFVDRMKEIFGQWGGFMNQLIGGAQQTFHQFFSGLFSGAVSLGDSLMNLAHSIGNAITNMLSSLASNAVIAGLLSLFFPGLGGFGNIFMGLLGIQKKAMGGIVQGGLVSAFAGMQHGGIVSRPTLAMVGEGSRSEAVVPLPDGRSIPVKNVGEDSKRPIELTTHIAVLFDRSQLAGLGVQPDQVVTIWANDFMSRGVTYRAVKTVHR